ncbi:MAG: ArnT family glycosyltransferase [Candidatus Limnocylindria bacterium]
MFTTQRRTARRPRLDQRLAFARLRVLGRDRKGPAADSGWLVPLVVLFLVKGVLLVAMVGPFTGHDEVDHFFYVARLAAGEGLGVVGEVELPAAAAPYESYVADYPSNAEVIQPPLYHLLLTPLYLAAPGGTETRLYALRLASVPIGAAVVLLAYATARLLFPADIFMRAGVPLFVALQPQLAFEAAIVNHDILLIAIVSLVVYLTLRGVRDGFSPGLQWGIGLAAAAGLWTKASFGLVLPVVAAGVVLRWRAEAASWRDLGASLARAVLVPLVLAMPWFARSFVLYGDPTGAERLRGIPGFGDQARGYGEMIRDPVFWRQLLEDFWGNYGWRQVPIDPTLARLVWIVWAVAAAGLVVGVLRALVARRRRPGPALNPVPVQGDGVLLLGLSIIMFGYGVLYVGTIQFTQARFAFPAMIGFGTLTMLGVAGWLPARARPALLPVVVALLMALNVVVALRFLLPFYYGPGGGAAVAP